MGRPQQRGIMRLSQPGHFAALQERLARSCRTLVPWHAISQQRDGFNELGGRVHRRFRLAARNDEIAVDDLVGLYRRQHTHCLRRLPLLFDQS